MASACTPSAKPVKDLIGRAKRGPHWGVQSRFRVIYICWSVGMPVVSKTHVGRITWPKRAHAQCQIWAVKTDL